MARPSLSQAPNAAGLWEKAEGGRSVAWILVIDHNGVFEGVIAKRFPPAGQNPARADVCSRCTDDRRNAPVLGLSFMRNMVRNGLNYDNGNMLNPRDGKISNARMSVTTDGQRLTVRSQIGPAQPGSEETWQRLPNAAFAQLDPAIVAKYLQPDPPRPVAPARSHLTQNAPAPLGEAGSGTAQATAAPATGAAPGNATRSNTGGSGGGGAVAAGGVGGAPAGRFAPTASSVSGSDRPTAADDNHRSVLLPLDVGSSGSANGLARPLGPPGGESGGSASTISSSGGVLKFPTASAPFADEASCKAHERKLGVVSAGPCVDMAGILRELEVGTYKFNAPDKAYLGRPFKFVLALATASDQDVDEVFDGVAGKIVERKERFAQSIEAVLHGDDLAVEPAGPQLRTATTVAPVIWDWSVTPQQGGKKKLAIEVFANIQIGLDRNRVQLRTLYQEIDIEVSTLQRIKNYVAEADGLLRAFAAVPALAVILGFIPKARAKFKAGWRFVRGEPKAARRRRV